MKKPASVVWIYAREDKPLVEDVVNATQALVSMGHITNWSPSEILPGQPWRQVLEAHLKAADIIVLGLSSNLWAQTDIQWQQVHALAKSHQITLIPLLLRATFLPDQFDELAVFPDKEKALFSNKDRAEVTRAFCAVLHGLVTTGRQPDGKKPAQAGTLLHLSDLHFREGLDDAKLLYQQLASHLRLQRIYPLAGLVISGDVTQAAKPEEFEAAAHFLNLMSQSFNLTPDRIVLVPGNHDVDWKASQNAYDVQRKKPDDVLDPITCFGSGDYYERRNEAIYGSRFQNFSDFHAKIKGVAYPLAANSQFSLVDFADLDLCFLGLNSSWQIDHHFRNRASINPHALMDGLSQLPVERRWKIAVFHHPLDSEEPSRLSDTTFRDHLTTNGFRVILHGHIHKTQAHQYQYDHSAKIEIVSSGTFGAPSKDWQPGYARQYNLLQLNSDQLTVTSFHQQKVNGAWERDPRWRTGPDSDPSSSFTIVC